MLSSQPLYIASSDPFGIVEKVRQEIDDKRASLLEALRGLNSRRNALTPVARLAPELLVKIFVINTRLDYPRPNLPFRVAPSLKSCSQVCQYWRRVALLSPTLWSRSLNFHMETPEWTSEILIRSNPMPLDVHADSASRSSFIYNNVSLALDHVPRIRVLNLYAPIVVMDELVAKLNQSAPLLEELSLHNSTDFKTFDIPTALFSSYTPRLRRLELFNCNLQWDSLMLQDLTHLQLSRVSSFAQPAFTTLFTVLGQMPMLEALSLSHILPQTVGHTHTIPVIHLPRLNQLRLEDSIFSCSQVLDHLVFPSNAVLYLNGRNNSPSSDYSKILALIGTKFSGNLLQRVHVRCTAQDVSIQGWITFDDDFDFDDYFARHMSICFYWGWDISDNEVNKIPQLTCDMFRALCLTNLWRLGVFVDQSQIIVADSAWDNLLSAARTVQHLCIRDPLNGPFFALVGGDDDDAETKNKNRPGGERAVEVLLPSLRRLLIEDADFARFATAESKCGLLLEWLIHRHEMNAAIEVVQIRSCGHIDPETVELLRAVVPTVRWDGMDREVFVNGFFH